MKAQNNSQAVLKSEFGFLKITVSSRTTRFDQASFTILILRPMYVQLSNPTMLQ